MDINSLITIGLSPQQAEAYALLIEHGELRPAQAAKDLNLTRTNAYKLLDRLVEMDLAQKIEKANKYTYVLNNPMVLTELTSRYRAKAVERENAVSKLMQELLAKYHVHSDKPDTRVYIGVKDVADAYRAQIQLKENIHFIHTKSDIPLMGFDNMHDLRVAQAQHGNKRQAIMVVSDKTTTINHESHKRSNLDPTWADQDFYSAPVEWSVTESSLLIVLYATEPHAILITDKIVAGAFLQLWQFMDSVLKTMPTHHKHKSKD